MRRFDLKYWLAGAVVAVIALLAAAPFARPQAAWSEGELKQIRDLWIGSLPPLPPDPSDRVADDRRAVELGRELFFDARFSANGYVACATCHRPEQEFQDGLPLGKGVATTTRRTQPLAGVAYGPWYFWDGRKDSLWAQALAPLEGPTEHGGHRFAYARTVRDFYAGEYTALFGALPDLDWSADWAQLTGKEQHSITQVFVNMGKAIEAYERTIGPRPTVFDQFAGALLGGDTTTARAVFSVDQAAGLKLFLGKGNCIQCHNTPLFSDHDFHNTGAPAAAGAVPDKGWVDGLPRMLDDEFGCKGQWSDAGPAGGCIDRRYLIVGMANQPGAFQTPSLRGVAARPPFMHAGQFQSLDDVVRHYSLAPTAPVGKTELKPLDLSDKERRQLIAFLGSLTELPSGPQTP